MSRYIDAEAFIEWMKMTRKMLTNDGERYLITGTKVSELVENFPTADVAEVRHGRWIDKSSSTDEYGNPISMCQDHDRYINIICSVCGYSITDRYGLYHYCPNCGAKMESEDE